MSVNDFQMKITLLKKKKKMKTWTRIINLIIQLINLKSEKKLKQYNSAFFIDL